MYRPNNKCQHQRRLSGRTLFGKPRYAPPVTVPCSVVNLSVSADHSSVRADSSASRGAAEQMEAIATLLFPVNVAIGIGDLVAIAGVDLRITSKVPRFTVGGRLDHLEVTGVIKEKDA